MKLKNSKQILKNAQKRQYAIGAYNFTNLEQLKAIIEASNEKNCDVIVQTSPSAIKYMGLDVIVPMTKALAKNSKINICLNLDHGKDFETIKKCVDAGYTNVMIDASDLTFEENIKLTKKCVEYAHNNGVTVEAELGSLKGAEDEVTSRESFFTKPLDAKTFVEKTGVDSLAISIGTSHGAYKFEGESYLDIERLKQIKQNVKIPLVLHGASGVSKKLKTKFIESGGKIGNANGVSDENLLDAVKNGICKVNMDTDLRIAFTTGIRISLKNEINFNPREYLTLAMEEMKLQIKDRIDVLTKNKI